MSTLHRVLSTNLCIPSRTTLIKWRDSPALRRSLKLYNPHCRGYQSAPMAPSLETGSKQLTSSLKPTSILHRTPWQPPVAKSAHGIYITLEDGKELIDAVGGAAVTCLGNSHPKVMQAIRDQLDKVSCTRFRFFLFKKKIYIYNSKLQCIFIDVYNMQLSNQPAEALAKKLVDTSGGAFKLCGFVSGGLIL